MLTLKLQHKGKKREFKFLEFKYESKKIKIRSFVAKPQNYIWENCQ